MATEIGKLYYDLTIDDKGLKSGLTSADKDVSGFGSKFAGMGKAVAAGAVVAGVAVTAFGVSSVKAFSESQDAITQTNAVLESTGGIAGVTADMVDKLASSIQNNSKFSDEQVRSAENMLLTFTKIGKDVFPEATQAVADMAQAMGQDLTSTSIQVGKALQDPVKGVTALQRVGVRLTDDQKKLVEQMVATGDTAGAQKLILAELKTEFGGSAEAAGKTFAGSLEKAKNKLNDLQEAIGESIVKYLGPLVDKFNEWFDSAGGVDGIMQSLRDTFTSVKDELSKLWQTFLNVYNTIVRNIMPILVALKFAWDTLYPPIATLISTLMDRLWPALNQIWQAVQRLWDALNPGLTYALGLVAAIVGGTLLAGLWLGVNILNIFISVVSFLIGVLADLVGWISNVIGWIGNLAVVVWSAFGGMKDAIVKAFQWAYDKAKSIWGGITSFFAGIGDGIKSAISGAMEGVKDIVRAAVNWIIDKANFAIRGVNKASPPGVPEIGEIPKLRTGVENFAGGLAFVHKGEMLMNLAPGTDVVKKSDVGAMMANSGGGNNITINLDGIMTESRDGTRRVAQNLVSALNESLRAQGKQEIGV